MSNDFFFVKDRFISSFPNCLAKSSKAKMIKHTPIGHPFIHPSFVLFTIIRYVGGLKAMSNQTLNASGHRTLKKQVINSLHLFTKSARGITQLVSLHHIILSKVLALLKYPFYPLFILDNGMNLISKSLTILTPA